MDYPQKVAPRKINLPDQVHLVPQVGHGAPIKTLRFHPSLPLLAALDLSPTVIVWSIQWGDVFRTLHLPPGRYDALYWIEPLQIAVRQLTKPHEKPIWFIADLDGSERWQPMDQWPKPLPKPKHPIAFKHPQKGWITLFPNAKFYPLKLKEQGGLLLADPLGRYVLQGLPQHIRVYDAIQGTPLGKFRIEKGKVVAMAIEPQGRWMVHLTDQGWITRVDPMRPEKIKTLSKPLPKALSLAISTQGWIAVGNRLGQIAIVHGHTGERHIRTPKKPPGFLYELLIREEVGYVGLRRETTTLYFEEDSRFHDKISLPSKLLCACEAQRLPGILAALSNRLLVELDLRRRKINPIAQLPFPLRRITSHAKGGILGLGIDQLYLRYGNTTHLIPWKDLQPVRRIALNRNHRIAALASPQSIQVIDLKTRELLQTLSIPFVQAMAFVTSRPEALMLVDAYTVLWRYQPKRDKLLRIGTLSPQHQLGQPLPIRKILHITADLDGSLRLLALMQNGHRHVYMVNRKNANASFMTSIISVDQTIVSMTDESGTWMGPDAAPRLRIVDQNRIYDLDEWFRQAMMTHNFWPTLEEKTLE